MRGEVLQGVNRKLDCGLILFLRFILFDSSAQNFDLLLQSASAPICSACQLTCCAFSSSWFSVLSSV